MSEVEREHKVRCPNCGSTSIIKDYVRGETTCSECGLVIDDLMIDSGPEWRAFTAEEKKDRSRVGSPLTLRMPDRGLSTTISRSDRDAYGRKISPRRRAQIYRIRKWQVRTRVHSSADRNLAQAMPELNRIASQIGVPKEIRETAAFIYRRALESGLVRGRSIESMVAASVYLACREHRIPRPLDEIEHIARVNRKELAHCVRLILRGLELKSPRPNAIDFIPRFASELRLSAKARTKAAEILNKAKEMGITGGKDPTGLAAAALYIAGILTGERRAQREIAEVAHVTEVTIRNRYKELIKKLNIQVDI
ncbi:MAG: transcription initiation factor IIB [Candidatus Freyarchaeota archaeon]|nr:transcription initiation factor IIB [Candidatus Freyrarchaeum guaymaensis]